MRRHYLFAEDEKERSVGNGKANLLKLWHTRRWAMIEGDESANGGEANALVARELTLMWDLAKPMTSILLSRVGYIGFFARAAKALVLPMTSDTAAIAVAQRDWEYDLEGVGSINEPTTKGMSVLDNEMMAPEQFREALMQLAELVLPVESAAKIFASFFRELRISVAEVDTAISSNEPETNVGDPADRLVLRSLSRIPKISKDAFLQKLPPSSDALRTIHGLQPPDSREMSLKQLLLSYNPRKFSLTRAFPHKDQSNDSIDESVSNIEEVKTEATDDPKPIVEDDMVVAQRLHTELLAVVGPPGCGKTRLAHILARRLGLRYLSLDGAVQRAVERKVRMRRLHVVAIPSTDGEDTTDETPPSVEISDNDEKIPGENTDEDEDMDRIFQDEHLDALLSGCVATQSLSAIRDHCIQVITGTSLGLSRFSVSREACPVPLPDDLSDASRAEKMRWLLYGDWTTLLEAEESSTTNVSFTRLPKRNAKRRLLSKWREFCPVASSADNELTLGNPEFAVCYSGRVYLLASREARSVFCAHPLQFLRRDVPVPSKYRNYWLVTTGGGDILSPAHLETLEAGLRVQTVSASKLLKTLPISMEMRLMRGQVVSPVDVATVAAEALKAQLAKLDASSRWMLTDLPLTRDVAAVLLEHGCVPDAILLMDEELTAAKEEAGVISPLAALRRQQFQTEKAGIEDVSQALGGTTRIINCPLFHQPTETLAAIERELNPLAPRLDNIEDGHAPQMVDEYYPAVIFAPPHPGKYEEDEGKLVSLSQQDEGDAPDPEAVAAAEAARKTSLQLQASDADRRQQLEELKSEDARMKPEELFVSALQAELKRQQPVPGEAVAHVIAGLGQDPSRIPSAATLEMCFKYEFFPVLVVPLVISEDEAVATLLSRWTDNLPVPRRKLALTRKKEKDGEAGDDGDALEEDGEEEEPPVDLEAAREDESTRLHEQFVEDQKMLDEAVVSLRSRGVRDEKRFLSAATC
ncbi:hypothetical protein BBP00_00001042 [Phytophthora kernoviae]|uniref:ATPase AAA-type core domain-containing protein n=1 Tax=Phytophthora kernoviae TaxID=325452 RepID=A0A3F2S1K0_9STRA|nr:hypothetical protein BBP00_00001042 [Phytophthora kernoviae]